MRWITRRLDRFQRQAARHRNPSLKPGRLRERQARVEQLEERSLLSISTPGLESDELAKVAAASQTAALAAGDRQDPLAVDYASPAAAMPNGVFETDNRIKVTNTTTAPWNRVVRVSVTFPNGTKTWGSGALVSPFHVLTAGHVVYSAKHGGWANSVSVAAGQYADANRSQPQRPYGEASSTFLRAFSGWTDAASPSDDMALITLDRNLGSQLGYFPYGSQADYVGTAIESAGYPADLQSGGQMYRIAGTVAETDQGDDWDGETPFQVYYAGTMDTDAGQDGSPVWRRQADQYAIRAVHSANNVTHLGTTYNAAAGITQPKADELAGWITTDKSPVDKPDLVDYDGWFGAATSTVSASTARPGDSVTVTANVSNLGTRFATGFSVSFYLSNNASISTADYLLGSVDVASLGAFAQLPVSWTGALPQAPAGTYHVGWVIDSANNQAEFLENNNTGIAKSLLVIPAVTSDVGDSAAAAMDTQLGYGNFSWDSYLGDGTYGLRDVDLYRVDASAGGVIVAETAPTPAGTSMDTVLRLFNGTGLQLAADDDSGSGLYSRVTYTIPAGLGGIYYIGVSGYKNDAYNPLVAGSGIATEKAGDYRLTIDVAAPDGEIRGSKWNDLDGDSVWDTLDEPAMAGWTIYIDANDNHQLDFGERSTVTDVNGQYVFSGVRPGNYHVREVQQAGWTQTYPLPSVVLTTAREPAVQVAPVLTTTNSSAIAYPTGSFGALEDVMPTTDESGPLIGIDKFRADPRFAGIDGRGYSTVIIDTGIDLNHPFFGPDTDGNGVADRIVFHYDFLNNDPDASDDDDHGSNVASIAASSDPIYTGMAPGANIIALKTLGPFGGTFSATEQALKWVVANARRYNIASVNMSLGDNGNYNSYQTLYGIDDELRALAAQNVLVVSASGNSYGLYGQPGVAYPSADPNSLSIGAVFDADIGPYIGSAIANTTGPDRITPFSQRDPLLSTVFAPGAMITGANQNGGTVDMPGTSQASPHIAGIGVLAQQLAQRYLGRRLTMDEFRTLLKTTGVTINDGDDEDDDVPNTGLDFKRVDVYRLAQGILGDLVVVGPGQVVAGVDFGNHTEIDWGDAPASPPSEYEITIDFAAGQFTPSQMAIFEQAASRWSQIIVGDVADVMTSLGLVDDLRIQVSAPAIDGIGGILGQAGPRELRPGNFLPATGIIQFDSADLAMLEAVGQLDEVVLHEMGHVIGFGTIWEPLGLLSGAGGADPRFTGAAATAEYQRLFRTTDTSIPVENTGGPGTADAHWRETVFDNELMTGWLNSGTSNPLSRITAAQFSDIGYQVSLATADPYTVPLMGVQPSNRLVGRLEVIDEEPIVLDPDDLVDPDDSGAAAARLKAARFDAQAVIGPLLAYPTLAANNGAGHIRALGGPVLGMSVDAEFNGTPDATATGDDLNQLLDDEDGVTFVSPLVSGSVAEVEVIASGTSKLDAWIDFGADSHWSEPGDQIFASQTLSAGVNRLRFLVPATASVGGYTFARFRLSTAGGLSYTGLAADGEVEDYQVVIRPPTFFGTPGDDVFSFTTDGVNHTVVINGVTQTFPAAAISAFEFDGLGGRDRMTVIGGLGSETATLGYREGTVTDLSYQVHFVSMEEIRVDAAAGGAQSATITDGPGADRFYGRLANGEAYVSYADGSLSWTTGFSRVEAQAISGGDDWANLYDSVDDDLFTGRRESSMMSRPSVRDQVVTGYERVYAYASGGGLNDRADIYDDIGNDTYTATPTARYLQYPGGPIIWANGFEVAEGHASAGVDTVIFQDSSGDDDFVGRYGFASMSRALGYTNLATGFEKVYAYASGGGTADSAVIDDAIGNDRATLRSNRTDFTYQDGQTISVLTFDNVLVRGLNGGDDWGFLYDSLGDDTYTGNLGRGAMSRGGADGYSNVVTGFDRIYAFGTAGGFDRATLNDSDGDDRLVAGPTDAYIWYYADNRGLNSTQGFEQVTGRASEGLDTAQLNGSAGDDTYSGTYAVSSFVRAGVFNNTVQGFDRVYAYANGGYDVATLAGDAGDDRLTFAPTSSSVRYFSDGRGLNVAGGFDKVSGDGGLGVDWGYFYDTTGNDVYRAGGGMASMTQLGVLDLSAVGLERAYGYASSGLDEAYLTDTPGNDLLVAKPTAVQFIHANGTEWWASGFDKVDAQATRGPLGGDDTANFLDSASTSETYEGGASTSHMFRLGVFDNIATNFDRYYAYSSGGNDLAKLTDSPLSDVLTAYPQDTYFTYGRGAMALVNYAKGFRRVESQSTTGGTDTALFYDSAASDLLTGQADWARLTDFALYDNYIKGFEVVTATKTNKGTDRIQLTPPYDYIFTKVGDWL